MTKKVSITNTSGALRYFGSLRLSGYASVTRDLTDAEIQKAKNAGFSVALQETKERVVRACHGFYKAFNDCNACFNKEDCQADSVNDENFPPCYGIDYGNNVWCNTRCNYKNKCAAILEPLSEDEIGEKVQESSPDSDFDALDDSIIEAVIPSCFKEEYNEFIDCDDCDYRTACGEGMIEVELMDKDPDTANGVEVLLVNKDPDRDSGVKVDITDEDPDADPSDDEPDWTEENIIKFNDILE